MSRPPLRALLLSDRINDLSRAQIVQMLQDDACIQCFDDESLTTLREALRLAIKNGDVPRRRLTDTLNP